MVGHGGSSAGSYLADPTSPIPSHCASIVATSTLRVNVAFKVSNLAFPPCHVLSMIYFSVVLLGKPDTELQFPIGVAAERMVDDGRLV